MRETKLTSEQAQVVQSNNGLKMYLTGLETGKEATPRSSLYNLEGKTEMLSPDAILNRWREKLSSLEQGNSWEQEVFQFDLSQLEKWGPQGGVAPISELLDDVVLPTFEGKSNNARTYRSVPWSMAKLRVRKMLWQAGAYSLRPASYSNVVDDMRVRDTLESNSGWPLFTKRSKTEVVEQSIKAAESGQWKTYPAIALFRNYNRKTRLVWMFPMSANLVEGSYFQPLQSALMNSKMAENSLAPWKGFETVREVVDGAYKYGYCVAASDFSSTDAHFQLQTTLEVFDVIKWCFQEKYREGLLETLTHMHSIPLVTGINSQIVGTHGVSSGSNWTNFIETIFDLILGEYVSIQEMIATYGRPSGTKESTKRQWKHLMRDLYFAEGDDVYASLYAIGDDMSWFISKDRYDPDFQVRLDHYGKNVGMEIKAEKTMNDPDKVKSLQRLFQRGYLRPDGTVRAVYSTIRALKSLVYPEKFHKPDVWSKDMEVIRDLMILENCVDHPLFEEFCKFVVAGDPYLLEFCKKSKSYQDSKFQQSKLLVGLNTTYNQERRDSALSEFSSVKFIANL